MHPMELRPYVERAIGVIEETGIDCTLRYHPLCHLSKEYWKYVTNALYVLVDSGEWDYGHCGEDTDIFRRSMLQLNEVTAIKTRPCCDCDAALHCGGWNRIYADGFNGADLTAITLPPEQRQFGYFFLQNPARDFEGFYRSVPKLITEGDPA